MGAESWLLIHEGSFGAVGSVGQVEDTVEWVKKIQTGSDDPGRAIDALEAAESSPGGTPRLVAELDEALKYGFCDLVS